MNTDFLKTIPGVIVKKTGKGTRFLLHDKDLCGKDIYTTIPIMDTDAKKDSLEKVEKARIKLNAKKNLISFESLIQEYIDARRLAYRTQKTMRLALSGFGFDETENRKKAHEIISNDKLKESTKNLKITAIRLFC